jgi:outer membrane protein assembly factor BamB
MPPRPNPNRRAAPFAAVVALGLAAAATATSTARAGENWPGFRGPDGQGRTDEKNLPVTWGGPENANVRWKVPLRGPGQSSPVVWGGKVFVTAAAWPAGVTGTKREETFPEHTVTCYDASDGRELWNTVVPPGPWLLKDLRGGYAAPTPAVDAERVYCLFGSSVIVALDHAGKPVWRKEIVPFAFDVAVASSPVLHGGSVLVLCDQTGGHSRLIALDRKTGEERWVARRPKAGFSHGTPIVVAVGGREQIVVNANGALQGLDAADGRLLWWAKTGGFPAASPVSLGGLVYADCGRGGPGVAVDPTGQGDVSATHVRWSVAQVPEGMSSPVFHDGRLYRLHKPGVLKCWDAATGAQVYAQRLEGVNAACSPVADPDGRLFLASAGRSFVIRAGPTCEILGQSDLGDDNPSSPAVAGGRLFLRGAKNLWCIGSK